MASYARAFHVAKYKAQAQKPVRSIRNAPDLHIYCKRHMLKVGGDKRNALRRLSIRPLCFPGATESPRTNDTKWGSQESKNATKASVIVDVPISPLSILDFLIFLSIYITNDRSFPFDTFLAHIFHLISDIKEMKIEKALTKFLYANYYYYFSQATPKNLLVAEKFKIILQKIMCGKRLNTIKL